MVVVLRYFQEMAADDFRKVNCFREISGLMQRTLMWVKFYLTLFLT